MDASRGPLPLNTAFRAARQRLHLSQDELAQALRDAGWTGCDRRAIQRYEQGVVKRPQSPARRALATVFGVPLRDLGFDNEPAVAEPSRPAVGRRHVLQGMALVGVMAGAGVEALRNLQADLDLIVGGQSASLEEWRQTVVEYGYSMGVTPANETLAHITSDLMAVRAAARRADAEHRAEWSSVVANLSMVMAKTLSNLHQTREARTWFRTAQNAADSSNDVDLSAWITSERLTRGMYEHQPVAPMLDISAAAIQRSSMKPGRGTAELSAVHAQLLSTAGRHTEAHREMRRAWTLLETLPSSVSQDPASFASWGPNRVHYTEAWIYAHEGDTGKVDRAVEQSRALLPASRQRIHTQLRLLQASGHIAAGDVSNGLHEASTALEALPRAMQTIMVSSMATMALDAIPSSDLEKPSAASYRELVGTMDRSAS